MAVQNTVKKGDVVALAYVDSVTYAFGSGRGTERQVRYTLAVVESAARDGSAKAIRRAGWASTLRLDRRDFRLGDIMVISSQNQPKARAAFHAAGPEGFESTDAIKTAILAH